LDLKEFYQGLSDEAKEKLKACKSEEEALQVLKDEKIELDPDLLDAVSGGMGNESTGGCSYLYCDHCACN
jgi:hypothetical protein